MIGSEHWTARQAWNAFYNHVLDGTHTSPRGRQTVEVRNAQFKVWPHQHLDPRVGRNISLDYIRREFLWYMLGDRFDTRIQEYAPIWKTCISHDGGINSNYGQYLFGEDLPFFGAMQHLLKDQDSRRCWIPILNTQHQLEYDTNDVPCHTGFGFRLIPRSGRMPLLEMSVHHRSLDMWWGAANDFPIAFLWQIVAQAYLERNGISCQLGPVIHTSESTHFYERHIAKAEETVNMTPLSTEVLHATALIKWGLGWSDIEYLLRRYTTAPASQALIWLFNFEGAYGKDDPIWKVL